MLSSGLIPSSIINSAKTDANESKMQIINTFIAPSGPCNIFSNGV